MIQVKIRSQNRQKKKEASKKFLRYTGPCKRNLVCDTVNKWQKKFGYNAHGFQNQDNPFLKPFNEEFERKAAKYCGGYCVIKKQTRFDKMRLKEEMGFKLEELPIRKKFKRADQIINTLFKKTAMFKLLNCK